MATLTKPAALKPGDTIGVVVPAGPLNRERIDRAFERIIARGYRLKTYGDIYRQSGYLAGDDATRAAELMAAFADTETSAVWCGRGGYGVMRLLHLIDFDVIRSNPKIFVGFSDITVLHISIQKHCNLLTFHGPNLQDGFGKPEDMPAATETALWRLLHSECQHISAGTYQYDLSEVKDLALQTICGGSATGRVTGGNLAMLNSTMGTSAEVDTADCILFLEDVSERLYRIDRYLTQLRLAGKFESVAGVLLGTFSFDEGDRTDSAAEISAFLTDFFANLGVPVVAGFPSGHERYNLTLPMGGQIKLDADKQQVTLLENCVATA